MRRRTDYRESRKDTVPQASREGTDDYGRVRSELGRYGSRKQRTADINLGLAILHTLCRPGIPLAYDDIAAWCGCSASAIQLIERKALQKLARRIGFRLGDNLEDRLERFCLPAKEAA